MRNGSFYPGIYFAGYGASKIATLLPGNNGTTNRWSVEVTTTNRSEDEYLTAVSLETSMDTRPRVCASPLFNILPADNRPTENSLLGNATHPLLPVQADTQVTPARTAVPAQTAPLPGIIPPAVIGGVLIIACMKKDRGLK